jgi:polysaccharide export outer membrane protein
MRKNTYFLFLLATAMFFSSCLPLKRMYFFYDQKPTEQKIDSLQKNAIQRIHKSDRLSVIVSSNDPNLTAYLNPVGAQFSDMGYLVDSSGSIDFPQIGKVKLEGLTSTEASELIKDKLTYYYKGLFVNVNLVGNVYFLTDKGSTKIKISNERLTIFEAIVQSRQSSGGAAELYDKKNDIWLIREDSGIRKFVKLNLNSKKIFESPYFYLKNNDLLYIQQSRSASLLSSYNPLRVTASVLSTISLLIILFTKLK